MASLSNKLSPSTVANDTLATVEPPNAATPTPTPNLLSATFAAIIFAGYVVGYIVFYGAVVCFLCTTTAATVEIVYRIFRCSEPEDGSRPWWRPRVKRDVIFGVTLASAMVEFIVLAMSITPMYESMKGLSYISRALACTFGLLTIKAAVVVLSYVGNFVYRQLRVTRGMNTDECDSERLHAEGP
ncbi:hypothetical protein LTR97_001329 [Elasticomyces elasticus]|uniref:Uncharacterized protein n=1 Tax=Elasticomyces elasticus TaxID=574655 RepID=A0AAN7WIR1_9PEZI|nr:hypothetical protein LTR97_001329 [Elasticomyces elasticus]